MIIVEGPDGAGKTTLANALFEKYKGEWPLAMGGSRGPSDEVVERVHEALAYEVKCGNRPVIHDRLFFSELVYGDVLRGKVYFNKAQIVFIKDLLYMMRIPIIMCLPPRDVVTRNVQEGDQLEGVVDNILALWNRYDRITTTLEGRGMNVRVFDYTRHHLPKVEALVEEYLTRREKREWSPS